MEPNNTDYHVRNEPYPNIWPESDGEPKLYQIEFDLRTNWTGYRTQRNYALVWAPNVDRAVEVIQHHNEGYAEIANVIPVTKSHYGWKVVPA